MTYYELLTLIPASLSEEDQQTAGTLVRHIVERSGGTVHRHNLWEKRRLAYPIGKERQGVYYVTEFELEPAKLAELERMLRLDKQVLRHHLVKSHPRTDAERAEEKRRAAQLVEEQQPKELGPVQRREEKPTKQISKEELDKKLDEILTDDMV